MNKTKQMKIFTPIISLLFLIFCSIHVSGQEDSDLTLIIRDTTGRNLSRDSVRVSSARRNLICEQGDRALICRGVFQLDQIITIEADGFKTVEISVGLLKSLQGIVVLTPSTDVFEVEVYAGSERSRLSPLGMSQVIVSATELSQTAAPVLDDALRQVAGFSTFRRTSGRQANPTTQGVSLRGVGSSGASRTAVIDDGVLLNDPFGGWVQWNRVVQPLISEVEVLRGGASGFYGNSAVSGAIVLKPLERRVGRFSGELFGGTQRSIGANGRISERIGDWFLIGGFSSLRTLGYIPVDESLRGIVDSPAGVRYDSFQGRLSGDLGARIQILFKPSFFGEVRTNGTGIQTNRTHSKGVIAGITFTEGNLQITGRVNGSNQVYDQMFSTVAANRNSETLNRIQRVPARSLGFSVAGTHTTAGSFVNSINFGVDHRQVRGASDEVAYVSGLPTIRTGVGGGQRLTSLFINDRFVRSRLVVNLSARGDFWNNYDGLSVSTPVSSETSAVTSFADRNYSRFSGRGGLSFQATSRVNLFASVSSSFRAPTLNELYRGFRVGNVITQPNDGLMPEKAWEIDSGLLYSTARFRVRGSLFRNRIADTVSNITISTSPSLITRQRRNVGRTVAQGFELEVEGRVSDSLTLTGGYLYADSTIRDFPGNPILVGLRIPQVARHQATLQTRWQKERFFVTKQFRISGPQFDDDLNSFRLEGFVQSDFYIAYTIADNVRIFAGVENLFNTRYSTARTPIRSVGPPFGARFGIRWN
jgi:outer membrane receptor protein involved in Fe transport